MPELHVTFGGFPKFAKAMKEAAPEHLIRATGKALYLMGKSDIAKMRRDGLAGLNIKSKGFRNSFKFKATDSRNVKSLNALQLSEYTGAKPMRIFQTGGTVTASKARLLTILTGSARDGSGRRIYTQKELKAMIASGAAKIIQTKAGPAIILNTVQHTQRGKVKTGAQSVILAWLKPRITVKKRIDFFKNFDSNASEHERLLAEAAEWAIEATINDDEFDEGEFS